MQSEHEVEEYLHQQTLKDKVCEDKEEIIEEDPLAYTLESSDYTGC